MQPAIGQMTGLSAPRGRRRLGSFLVVAPLFAVLFFLIPYPVGILLLGSVSKVEPTRIGEALRHLDFSNYAEMYGSPALYQATLNSVVGCAGGALLAMLIGLFFAWVVARTDVKGKGAIEIIAIMPLFISPLVASMAWGILASDRAGILNIFFKGLGWGFRLNIYSFTGIWFVLGVYYAPYVYMFLTPALRRMDPVLEEASTISGASTWQTVRRVTFPLIIHPILSAAILVFVITLGLFAVPATLAVPANLHFLTTYLFNLVTGNPPAYEKAATVSVLLIALTFLGVFLQRQIIGKKSFVTVTGKSSQPRLFKLRRWRPAVLALVALYLCLTVVLPYLALILVSVRRFMFLPDVASIFDAKMLTMQHFQFVWSHAQAIRSIGNSVYMGAVAALAGSGLCFLTAYCIHRTELPGRKSLDYLSMIPIAVPGLVIGVAYLWAWISFPVPIYGTIWVLALAYVARFIPDGVRAAGVNLLQIHKELEESSRIHGGSFWQTLWRVMVPLARPGLLSSMVLLFILSVRELGSSIFLYTTESIVLSVQIYNQWESGELGATAVLSLVQTLFLVVVVVLARKYVMRAETA
ncbi:MAG: iron ABC transporter permease [Candidatus Tectomicrobia bacterium]|nr:iron ABC transporter permease [Candidatus Tectomicrobia bacterium]